MLSNDEKDPQPSRPPPPTLPLSSFYLLKLSVLSIFDSWPLFCCRSEDGMNRNKKTFHFNNERLFAFLFYLLPISCISLSLFFSIFLVLVRSLSLALSFAFCLSLLSSQLYSLSLYLSFTLKVSKGLCSSDRDCYLLKFLGWKRRNVVEFLHH